MYLCLLRSKLRSRKIWADLSVLCISGIVNFRAPQRKILSSRTGTSGILERVAEQPASEIKASDEDMVQLLGTTASARNPTALAFIALGFTSVLQGLWSETKTILTARSIVMMPFLPFISPSGLGWHPEIGKDSPPPPTPPPPPDLLILVSVVAGSTASWPLRRVTDTDNAMAAQGRVKTCGVGLWWVLELRQHCLQAVRFQVVNLGLNPCTIGAPLPSEYKESLAP